MHVLVLPKWYTGRNDPQLGDFVRKQMLATARVLATDGRGKVSVVFTVPLKGVDKPVQELAEDDGAWELRCYYPPSTLAFAPLRKIVNLWRYWRSGMSGVRRTIRERGLPDLTHVHILVRPALLALWLKISRGIPYVLSEQSSEYLDGTWAAKSTLFKALNRHLFRRAAAITAVSTHLGEGLKALALCRSFQVVPNTVPGTDLPLPPGGDPSRFMVVADLVDKTKNVSGVLRALKAGRDAGHELRLDVIGDGSDMAELRRIAADLGLNGSVHWHGRLSNADVLRHMSGTGAVIINSNVETFSVVTGEALALGKPVIATRCGGPVAFILPENGVLIEPQDDQALAASMIAFATSQRTYDPQAIRRSVSDRFSPTAVGNGFLSVYQRVLGNG